MRFYSLLPLACLFVFLYPVMRLSNWYSAGTVSIYQSLALWVVSVVVMWYSFSAPKMTIRYLAVHWMGISFVFAVLTLFAEGLRLILPIQDVMIVQGVLVVGVLGILFSILLSHHLSIKRQEIFSHKVSRGYRIVQISDVHIGSRQGGFMRRIVNRLNTLDADYVVVTGDLIDSSTVDYQALESIKQINAPVFFVIGNHERYADLPKIIDLADRLGMKTLRQESAVREQLVFSGIDDADDHKNQVARHLPSLNAPSDKFNILLYHRPVGWEAAIEHGIDLMLSGHTHNGQIFPFNFIVKQQYNRIAGMYRQGNSRLYVSSGTGTWGPYMRLGSLNEITVFDIKPEQPE